MDIPLSLQAFAIEDTQLEIYVPELTAVAQVYSENKIEAYWAQVWPASVGLCGYLYKHPEYITDKNVLELAAGLGLPGLYIARLAKQIHITDRDANAVRCVQQSVIHLQLSNVNVSVLDWKDARHLPLPEVLLLSDVNYEPAVFNELQQVLEFFLQNNVKVIISTPQRLVAKQFINSLQQYFSDQWSTCIESEGKSTDVSVFVLQHK